MPRKEDQKNWKYKECFKSNRDGSCNWCKSRFWNEGNKIYAMKKDDGKWIACTDKKCYLEQGGILTLFSSPSTEQQHVSLDDMNWNAPEPSINYEKVFDALAEQNGIILAELQSIKATLRRNMKYD